MPTIIRTEQSTQRNSFDKTYDAAQSSSVCPTNHQSLESANKRSVWSAIDLSQFTTQDTTHITTESDTFSAAQWCSFDPTFKTAHYETVLSTDIPTFRTPESTT
jgi:hypothetical protein